MLPFPDEFCVSKIHSVMCYQEDSITPENADSSYPFALYCHELVFYNTTNLTTFKGESFLNEPDSMLYLPKGIDNAGYRVHRITAGNCIDIYFDVDCEMPDHAIQFKNNSVELRDSFSKLYNIWSAKKDGYYPLSMSLFYSIISQHNTRNMDYRSLEQRRRLERIDDYIRAHYRDEQFDYQELCNTSGFSYSYFKKLFISYYHLPPVKYIMHLKMNYARELLITNLYSVTEVAHMCGYSDLFYFSALFKKTFGVSPSSYKSK